MFDFHLGAKLQVSSNEFLKGFFISGSPGQGRTTTVQQILLDIIHNKQTGLFVEPYGNLSMALKENLETTEAKEHTVFLDLDCEAKDLEKAMRDHFVVASGSQLKEGARATAEKGRNVLKTFYGKAQKGQWLVVDEAFMYLDDQLFEQYTKGEALEINTVLSDTEFHQLSEVERRKFAKSIQNYILFKPRNLDAVMLAKEKPQFEPEKIKAIKQFHFQYLIASNLGYDASKWPIDKI